MGVYLTWSVEEDGQLKSASRLLSTACIGRISVRSLYNLVSITLHGRCVDEGRIFVATTKSYELGKLRGAELRVLKLFSAALNGLDKLQFIHIGLVFGFRHILVCINV